MIQNNYYFILNSNSFLSWVKLGRTQDVTTSTVSMHIYGSGQAGLPQARLPGRCFICYTGSVKALPGGGLFFRLHLRRKASLFCRECKAPSCSPGLTFPRQPLVPTAQHKEGAPSTERAELLKKGCRVFSNQGP